MSAKRILILTNRVPYPLNDGGNMAMNAMVKGYHNTGWDVYLLSMNTSRHHIEGKELNEIYQDIYCFETVEVDNSVTAIQLIKNFLFSKEPNHADRFYDERFMSRLLDVINAFKPNVIQTESVFLATYLPKMRSVTDAVQVLRMHNIEYQIWTRLSTETKNPIKQLYIKNLAKRIKLFEEKVWKSYDLLLPITINDANIATGTSNENVHVAPFGIDIAKVFSNKKECHWVGYHIGAMDWLPNQEGIKWFLQHVWPIIHNCEPSFEFHFAGRNMPDSFKELNYSGVTCAGMVASADDFIADKRILIVPIMSGGGIRVKILEAMAAGKIVISTSVGMQGIDAIPQKHFLLANTSEEFRNAIKWCLANKEDAITLSEEGKVYIKKHYNLFDIADKLNEKLELLIS